MQINKKLPLIILVFLGTLISIIILMTLLNHEKKTLSSNFNRDSAERIQRFNWIFKSNQNTLLSLRDFFYGSNFVDEDEFRAFISTSLKDETGLTHIAWFPKVEKGKTEDYQFLYGPINPEQTESDYQFPLTFLESITDGNELYGLDFTSIYKESMTNLLLSLKKEEIILAPSDRIKGFLDIDESIIMILPVYRGKRTPLNQNKNMANLKGFVLSVISIERIVNFTNAYFENNNIVLSIVPGKTTEEESSLLRSEFLTANNDNWNILCLGNDNYRKSYQTNLPLIVFIISIFLVLLLSAFFYKNTIHIEKIELDVDNKNKELEISQKRLDLAVEGGELGCWELDFNTGRITTNSQFSRMMGYTGNIIDSMESFFKMIHEDDRPEVVSKFKQHINGKSLFFESEHRISTRNNHWLWILTKGQVVERDSEGNPLQLSGVQIDISKMKNMQNILQKEATVDELTGLFNRRYFKKRLDGLIEKSKRTNNNFSIALIDVDLFKEVNNIYGRKAGDLVLIKFATFLQNSLRPYDFVGRIGGDKFEIVFENESLENIQQIMERIRRDVESMDFLLKEEKINITFSAGLSSFSEVLWQGGDEDKLFNLASTRLLHAKESGRNRVV